ncbi:hypothetical protein PA99_1451 [Pseudomonas aeruginosa PA99]|nr:hypothetical protein PA99_1451 [Pseudomonas aeruginosa PA99]
MRHDPGQAAGQGGRQQRQQIVVPHHRIAWPRFRRAQVGLAVQGTDLQALAVAQQTPGETTAEGPAVPAAPRLANQDQAGAALAGMLQEGPRHLAGAQHDDLAAEPLGQLLRTLQAHPRLLAAQAAGIDVYHAPGQVPTFGNPAGVAHQAFGLFVTVDAHQQPPAQRRRFLAALAVAVVEVGVDPRGGGLHRQFTQRGEVGLREERIDRRPRLFRHVDLALAQALQQLARRQVDEDDLVGLLQHPVRHRLADLHAGDVADLVVEALQVLDVDRCVDVDSRRQQLLDVLPALGVAAAGNVAVGQFVDQGQRRRVGEETVEVHFLQFHPSILEAAQRLLRHACEEGLGFRPRVGLDHPGAQFHALAQLGLGGLQHGEGLAHPRRRAEKDFQAAAPVSGQVGQQRVGACGVGHGSVVLRCSAPRRADDRRRSSADAAILQALAWVSGET